MPERNWHIRIERVEGTAVPPRYRVSVNYGRGFNEKFHVFKADLPPSFADLVEAAAAAAAPAAEADAAPKRGAWRFKSGEVPPDMLAYHAGDLATLQQIGARLYNSIFVNPETGNDFTDVLDRDREEFGVRIALEVSPDLARVPWEAMLPPGRDTFMATRVNSNVVRLANAEVEGDPPPPATLPLRLLIAVANPDRDLATGAEVANIERRVDALRKSGNSQLELVEPLLVTTRTNFREAIFDHKPHIVHFIGHGDFRDGEGLIDFHDDDDASKADPIGSDDLRSFFEDDKPWLVVLNSCLGARASVVDPFGGAAHNLIRANIPFVVAMQYPISDDAAIAFSRMLYAALGRGARVPDAVSRARMAIRTIKDEAVKPELITPVLYLPRHSTLDSIAIAPPPAVAPVAAAPPPAAAAAKGGWRRRTVMALAFLLGVPVMALIALLFLNPRGDRGPALPSPDAPSSAGETAYGAASEAARRSGGGAAPTSRRWSLWRPEPALAVVVGGSGVGYGSAVRSTDIAPRARLPRDVRDTRAKAKAPPDHAGRGETAFSLTDIAVSASARRESARVFVGGATAIRDGDVGIAGALTLAVRGGGWSHRLHAAIDHLPRRGDDRSRIAADYAGARRIGDGLTVAGEIAYARNDALALTRRFVEGVTVRWSGDVGQLPVTVAAGPVAAQTRFDRAIALRGDPRGDARRSALGGLARIEAGARIGDAVDIDARAQVVAAGTLSTNARVTASYGLSDRASLVASTDIDHERDAPQRRRTSVIGRIGLAIDF